MPIVFFCVNTSWAIFALICAVVIMQSSTANLQSINLGEHLYYRVLQNLVYRCRNVHLTTIAGIKVPPVSCSVYATFPWNEHPISLSHTIQHNVSNFKKCNHIFVSVAWDLLALISFTTLIFIAACITV